MYNTSGHICTKSNLGASYAMTLRSQSKKKTRVPICIPWVPGSNANPNEKRKKKIGKKKEE